MRGSAPTSLWDAYNQRCLSGELAALGKRLGGEDRAEENRREAAPDSVRGTVPPPAIDALASIFGLSIFEREVVLLLAGIELDSALASQCGQVAGRVARAPINFSFAMATLRDPHWNALAPSAPLRRFRLVEIEPGHGLTYAPLHIDERVLHYLVGVNKLDDRLAGFLAQKRKPERLSDEHLELVAEILRRFGPTPSLTTLLHLCGDDPSAQENVAALLAHHAGRELYVLRHEDTPPIGAELDQFVRLWTREGMLLPASLLLQWEGEIPSAAARRLAEKFPRDLTIATRESPRLHRVASRYEVNKPDAAAQKRLWIESLGDAAPSVGANLDQIAQQFRFSADTIDSLARTVQCDEPDEAPARLWSACRTHCRPRLETLAERIVPAAGWEDLILPAPQTQTLRSLVAQSRHRMTVYESWGFAARGRRGLGLSALFSGPSGTGKTLAAEVLARELELDLYRIDLSSVVSKYIGETEKNLRQVFDAAETGGVLLLFDEADALFGKRSEVKDSHDRYANIEVGYLLQRIESFQGLAVLTTNAKASLDKAFQRRLRFSVDFPFPDAPEREGIWRRVLPPDAPTAGLDPRLLASLNVSGGNIRTIALNAAFLAAEAGQPIGMGHMLEAARLEADKIERPLAERETRGWK
ncbi:MAG TPA: ATP-binding protein [Polyangiaceae bacterium]